MAAKEGRCHSCGQQVLWARDEAGKRVPLDPEPVGDGVVLLVETENGKLLAFVKRWIRDVGYGYRYDGMGREWFGRYARHSATCPAAEVSA